MTELSIGNRATFVGGVRYEYSNNKYRAHFLWEHNEIVSGDKIICTGVFRDTTTTKRYGEWCPMAQMKINLIKDENNNGIDLRLAATRTLARPNYYDLTGYINISQAGKFIERSEPNLKPTTAWNYDAFLTLYSNRLGLFTLGGFYKELKNIDVIYARFVEKDVIQKRFPQLGAFTGYTVVEPINLPDVTKVYGFETEVQANLSFLPSPLDGFLLYGNFSRIFTRTLYPMRVSYFDMTTYTSVVYDTTRVGRMPGQADKIINLAIGYDKGRFSGRLSYYFQGKAVDWLGADSQNDGWADDYERWDLSLTFRVWGNASLVLNVNNLNNRRDRTFYGVRERPNRETIYGTRVELGLRVDLSG